MWILSIFTFANFFLVFVLKLMPQIWNSINFAFFTPILVLWKKYFVHIGTFCKLWMQMGYNTGHRKHFANCKKIFFLPPKSFNYLCTCCLMAWDVMILIGENPISRAIGRGEPWKSRLSWALKWQGVKPVPFGPKKVDYLNIWVGCWMLVACLLQQLYGFKSRHLYKKWNNFMSSVCRLFTSCTVWGQIDWRW